MVAREWVVWLLSEYRSPETRRGYREKVAQADRFMVATFGRHLLRTSPKHVQAYLRRFGNPKTRNCQRSALRAYFRFAKEAGYRKTDPAGECARVKEPTYLPRPLSRAAAYQLRAAATTLSLRHRILVDVALFAGLRRSELARLQWADVDLRERRLRVMGKGRKERVIPLHAELADELRLWRLVETGEFVFPSPYGAHVTPMTIARWFAEVKQTAGVRFTPHQLRHTFATALTEERVDSRHVQELLGHASPATTMIYSRVAVGHLEEDIARLDFGA